jgi:hypothetical protein
VPTLGGRRVACSGHDGADSSNAWIDHADLSDDHGRDCLVASGDGSDEHGSVRVVLDVDLPEGEACPAKPPRRVKQ